MRPRASLRMRSSRIGRGCGTRTRPCARLTRQHARDDGLGSGARTFLNVSAHDGDGVFDYSAVPDLPATPPPGRLLAEERRSACG
jgi:hypothetical protein